jgi:hypothetical protein
MIAVDKKNSLLLSLAWTLLVRRLPTLPRATRRWKPW